MTTLPGEGDWPSGWKQKTFMRASGATKGHLDYDCTCFASATVVWHGLFLVGVALAVFSVGFAPVWYQASI